MLGPWGYLEAGKAHHQALLEEAERERGLKPFRRPWNGVLARLLKAAAKELLRLAERLERKEAAHTWPSLGNMGREG
ncbi:hypothetical protein YIM1640_03590 [Thermus oshimai]|jgi:hypothetical protein|uniref:hypothetical protein n=1 Tax=Thermus TaxID=270 RepID=UPI0003808E05|nr:hypothetical protein [Thermus oshimai]